MLRESQINFLIPWSLEALIIYLSFHTFGCTSDPSDSILHLSYESCCIIATQLMLINLNYSFGCNQETHYAEIIVYEVTLFAEIVYNSILLVYFLSNLTGHDKDFSILLIAIMVANQILIMDFIFRAAYQKSKKQKESIKLQKDNRDFINDINRQGNPTRQKLKISWTMLRERIKDPSIRLNQNTDALKSKKVKSPVDPSRQWWWEEMIHFLILKTLKTITLIILTNGKSAYI